MSTCRVFFDRMIIGIKGNYHEVHLLTAGKELTKEHAYISGDFVYIFRGTKENVHRDLSEFIKEGDMWIINDKVVIGEIHSDELKKLYSIYRIKELSLSNIFEDIKENSNSFNTIETIEAINNNSEVFTPILSNDDDFLKYLIKKAIINKKINLKNYKDKFASQNDLNNMKSGLTHKTKMSVPYFLKWLEVLGLKCKIELSDDGTDPIAPMTGNISIDDTTTFTK